MRRAIVAAIAVLAAASGRAQFVQYIEPGSLALEQTPTQERLESAMKEARFHLGPLRIGPWFAIKDLGYMNNVYGTTTDLKSDYTATFGAGAHAYLPVGPKLIVGAYALPEYVWWHNLASRRGWNGRGGAGLFGYFNRLTLEVQAGVSRQQQYPSSEVEVPVNVEDQHTEALLEVRVAGQLSLFGRGNLDRWRYNERGLIGSLGAELVAIERNETQAGGGVRFHFTDEISVGVGAERITTDFIHPEHDLSNSGTAPLLELDLQGAHLHATVSAIALDQRPKESSGFIKYSGTAGQFRLGWRPHGKLELAWYGARDLVYSVYAPVPYYIDERTGISAQTPLGWRSTIRAFVEAGRDTYVATPAFNGARTDDLKAYGAAFNLKLSELVTLVVGGSRTEYTTDLGAYNRSVTQVQTSLQFNSGAAAWW